jgi:L-lactate dehydrogenase complex protein LldG
MTSRDTILRRIHDALGPDPHPPAVPRDYTRTSHLDTAPTIALFADRVDDYRATVHHCTPDDLPATIATALGRTTRRIVIPHGLDADWLTALPGDVEVIRDDGSLDPTNLDTCDAVVSAATLGIAETGTIVLDASPDQGRRAITLVPDLHVCVIRTGQIVHTVPEGLALLDPTRPLTLISGPSATSDIELDRVEGVHGPRTLHVIVLDEGP